MKLGLLSVDSIRQLDKPVVVILKLSTQPPNVLQQVCIRKETLSRHGYLRLGETPGDEACCWIAPDHAVVLEGLGTAEFVEDDQGRTVEVKVTPIGENHALDARAA